MTFELFLFSLKPSGEELSDSEKRIGQRVGSFLAAQGTQVENVLFHDTPFCKELAHKLVKAMGCGVAIASSCNMTNPDAVGKIITDNASDEHPYRLLCIASEPEMRLVWKYFFPQQEYEFSPRSLIHLSYKQLENNRDRWSLDSVLRHSQLPTKFPFPAPNGPEQRKRPAYYYSQSAVIPFRRTADGIDVLLIGSSKRKHLVVPKGIHEPGFSAQESAAKEAFEEAGIRGPVSANAIGSYEYEKWGATCSVTVYAQEVTELLPEQQWQESHRGREWIHSHRAVHMVKEPNLALLIEKLDDFLLHG